MILLATLPSDAHSWNLLFVHMLLAEHGLALDNLGVCTPLPVLLRACVQRHPRVVLISATNGHHAVEGMLLAQHIHETLGSSRPALALAGDLTSPGRGHGFQDLLAAGFDAVFCGSHAVPKLLDFCQQHALQPSQRLAH